MSDEADRLAENKVLLEPYLGNALEGCRVHHAETGPSFSTWGTLQSMTIEAGDMLTIRAVWDGGHEFEPTLALRYASVLLSHPRQVCGRCLMISARFSGGNDWVITLPDEAALAAAEAEGN